jgi:excisionase family DNA binding protein
MSDTLMSIKQVAEYLQINKMTVYKLARSGAIPAFRVASEWRFRKDLVDQWLMSQLEQKSGKEAAPSTDAARADGRKTLLVVDDEEMFRRVFTLCFQDTYRILTAANGEEALKVLREAKPDVVLLDFKMPGMDGIETLRRIREIAPEVAVVMLSAHGSPEIDLQAARLGALRSLEKPFDPDLIKQVVRGVVERNTST